MLPEYQIHQHFIENKTCPFVPTLCSQDKHCEFYDKKRSKKFPNGKCTISNMDIGLMELLTNLKYKNGINLKKVRFDYFSGMAYMPEININNN